MEAYDKHTSQYAVKHADWDKSKSTQFGIVLLIKLVAKKR